MTCLTQRSAALLIRCLFLLQGFVVARTAEAATYYVATSGDDTHDGMSPERAWATVTHAGTLAAAGDTVYIKAGKYLDEEVVIENSGTEAAPIIFQGYTDTPGDSPDPQYSPGVPLDSTVLPVLEAVSPGLQTYPGTAIGLWDRSYVEIRNIGVTLYQHGVFPQRSNHIVIENVYAVDLGVTSNQGAGIWVYDCSEITIRHCVVEDASMTNYDLMMIRNSVVEDCRSYAETAEEGAVTDYHIVIIDGQDNVVRNCEAENLHSENTDAHPGHGIGIKDFAKADGYPNPHSENNQIVDCVAINTYENFFVAHEAHDNEFIGCSAINDRERQDQSYASIIIRDGAHHNTFREFRGKGARSAVIFQETIEGPDGAEQVVSNNTIVNSTFIDSVKGIELWSADENTLTNCVFDGVGSWVFVRFPFERVGHGNRCRNSIVTNITGDLFLADEGSQERFAFTYTDFWQNSFGVPEGEGNVGLDPLFTNAAENDYHLRSRVGRWDPASETWAQDSETSPCIDLGEPTDDYAEEPCPNGARINLGAFGNTKEASLSSSTETCIPGEGPESDSGSDAGCSCRTRNARGTVGGLSCLACLALGIAARRSKRWRDQQNWRH
jgi:parallel beta-helix repeat protein